MLFDHMLGCDFGSAFIARHIHTLYVGPVCLVEAVCRSISIFMELLKIYEYCCVWNGAISFLSFPFNIPIVDASSSPLR